MALLLKSETGHTHHLGYNDITCELYVALRQSMSIETAGAEDWETLILVLSLPRIYPRHGI